LQHLKVLSAQAGDSKKKWALGEMDMG